MFPVKQLDQQRIDTLLQEVIKQAMDAGLPVSMAIEPKVIINTRAKKRLGACKAINGTLKKRFTIELGSALLNCREDKVKEILAHEVIHTCKGAMNHGDTWKRYANIMNQTYGYHIKRLADVEYQPRGEIKYIIRCTSCGREGGRLRKSRIVTHTSNYRCRCGGKLVCRKVD